MRHRHGRLGWLAPAVSLLLAAACSDSASRLGGVGDPCDDLADCEPGLYCGPDGRCYDPGADGDGDADGDPDGDVTDCVDLDGDGHDAAGPACPTGDDCDDSDPTVHPGAEELCDDRVDNDCDGDIDEPPCSCRRGDRVACYSGPEGTAGVGICRRGVRLCGPDEEWGPCEAEVVPESDAETACDGRDEDCDGVADDGLTNPCGGCGEAPLEVCGDSLDNDCDGEVDEGCDCDPGCLCDHDGCTCRPPTDQPCYDGPPSTLGFGICRGGVHDCEDAGGGEWAWGECRGQVLPATECEGGVANGVDDDCDGAVDEDCLPDGDGDGFSPPEDCDDSDPTVSPAATEECNGRDDDCDGVPDDGVMNACGGCGEVGPEVCGNGYDDDCDGSVDEDCACGGLVSQPCYSGPPGTEGTGLCRAGVQECIATSEFEGWGPCVGEVPPGLEVCNGADDDCDGETDERWAVGSNPCGYCVFDETCDGIDNDCDGLVDEGLRNACGDCLPVPDETVCDGIDNDCDGLVDEGLVNACGLCPPAPCYVDSWTTEEEFDEGAYDGTSTSPAAPLHPDCADPDTVCLDARTADLGHLWIANANHHEVVRMNVDTGAVELEIPSGGRTPSRTAVDTRDGSVWVANRAYLAGEDYNDPAQSNVVHFAFDGTEICRTPLPGMVRALAIDGDYDIWAGLWAYQEIVHIDGTTCAIIERQAVGCSPYGAAVDAFGNVWFACNSNWAGSYDPNIQSLVQVDVTDITSYTRHIPPLGFGCFNLYGLAVDSLGRAWVGSYACGSVLRYDPTSDLWARADPGGNMRGVAVAADGYVYVSDSSTNRRVIRIHPETLAWEPIALGAAVNDTVGAAVDYADRLWVVSRGTDNASRIDLSAWPAYTVEHFYTNGDDPYTYSDMTGMQHLLHTTPTGTWTVDFDSGYADALWATVEWTDLEPAGTDVTVRARTAPSQPELAAGVWSSVYTTSPASLAGDPTIERHGRWIQVEVTLATSDTSVTPVLYDVSVSWEY